MVTLENILRIATVIVSLGVVSAPILYPRYSLFARRARSGIQKLREVRETREDVRLAYVEKSETGFRELIGAAEVVFGYSGNPERLCVAIGHPKALGEFTGFGMEYGIGDNGVLYVDEGGGNKELLRWEPWSPTLTLDLEKLRRGIELRAKERSHFITMFLAVAWATLSIVIAI